MSRYPKAPNPEPNDDSAVQAKAPEWLVALRIRAAKEVRVGFAPRAAAKHGLGVLELIVWSLGLLVQFNYVEFSGFLLFFGPLQALQLGVCRKPRRLARPYTRSRGVRLRKDWS